MKTAYHPVLYKSKVKALGLIGYGHIAQKVAKIGHTFSMKIIFYNHRLKKVPESWIQQVSFDELLRQSDVLSLHVIQTPETIDLINNDTIAKEIGRSKSTVSREIARNGGWRSYSAGTAQDRYRRVRLVLSVYA